MALPGEHDREWIAEHNVSVQINCCHRNPEDMVREPYCGIRIPSTKLYHVNINDPDSRVRAIEKLVPIVQASLVAGEGVVVHDKSGTHRAGGVCLAILLRMEGRGDAPPHVFLDRAARFVESQRPEARISSLCEADPSVRPFLLSLAAKEGSPAPPAHPTHVISPTSPFTTSYQQKFHSARYVLDGGTRPVLVATCRERDAFGFRAFPHGHCIHKSFAAATLDGLTLCSDCSRMLPGSWQAATPSR